MLYSDAPTPYTRWAVSSTIQLSIPPATPRPRRPSCPPILILLICLTAPALLVFLLPASVKRLLLVEWSRPLQAGGRPGWLDAAPSEECPSSSFQYLDGATGERICRYEAAVKRHLPRLSCSHSPRSRPFTFSGVVPFCPTPDAFALSTAAFAQHFPLPIPQGSDGVLSLMHKWSAASAVGVGEQLLSDSRVRRSREVAFNASHTQWQPSDALTRLLDSVLKGVWRAMLPQEDIYKRLEDWRGFEGPGQWHLAVHKLLLYSEGDFFTAHSDTYKAEGQVATVIVRLPVQQQTELRGGELHVRRRGEAGEEEEVVWRGVGSEAGAVNRSSGGAAELQCGGSGGDGASGGAEQVEWVAFYSDCVHEVTPVESGVRVVLVLNFIRSHMPTGAVTRAFPRQWDLVPVVS